MNRVAAAACVLMLTGTTCAQLPVAKAGRALVRIYVSDDASEPELRAAEELSNYLSAMTGTAILQSRILPAPQEPAILVGPSNLAKSLSPGIDWVGLPSEEAILKSVGNRLIVAGGRPRGTLYAAERLLYRLGVRWWTPWATDLPNDRNLTIPSLDVRESPFFEYRSSYWHSAFDPDWAVRNGLNFGMDSLRGARGSGVEYAGFVHTFYPLVPPEENFKTHPEWYSLIDGKRTASNAQLCTTDPNLRAYMLDRVKALLRANPNASIVSVSQNDCFNQCQCDRCQTLAREEGSQSAPIIALANYIADGIAQEFPNVAVDTLAYQWSRHAPKTLKPRPNVIVRLCSIECDFGQPLDAPKNADFAKDVNDWFQLTHRLYIWDYVTNFGLYVQPMPNEAVMGPNLKFFAAHGVRGVFEEGDYTSNGGAWSELKAWLLAQLLWDPSQDSKRLIHEFMAGYYGRASEFLERAVALMDEEGAKTSVTFNKDVDAPFLTYQTVMESERLFQAAEKAVRNDSDKLWRVRQSHLAIEFVLIRRWEEFKAEAEKRQEKWPLKETRRELLDRWVATATGSGPVGWQPMTALNESGLTPAAFQQLMIETAR